MNIYWVPELLTMQRKWVSKFTVVVYGDSRLFHYWKQSELRIARQRQCLKGIWGWGLPDVALSSFQNSSCDIFVLFICDLATSSLYCNLIIFLSRLGYNLLIPYSVTPFFPKVLVTLLWASVLYSCLFCIQGNPSQVQPAKHKPKLKKSQVSMH